MARHRVAITKRQPGMGSHPLMRYDQAVATLTIGSSSPGDDFLYTLFDNSGLAGGKYLKIGKMTMQWWVNFNQDNLIYLAVMKVKEGDAAPSLDDETEIRDARSEGRLVRGPWQIATVAPGVSTANVLFGPRAISRCSPSSAAHCALTLSNLGPVISPTYNRAAI